MQEQEQGQKKPPGHIQRMFDWTFAILVIVILVGIAWKYVIKPLYLG